MRARLLLLLVFAIAQAKEVVVKDASELRAAVGAAMPGDVIKLAKGRYNDVSLRLTRGGTESRPITLAAAEPGEVIFAGASEVELAAPYLVLDGLYFLGGALAGDKQDRAVITFGSHHGIVRQTAVVDYNPAAFKTGYYWVFFQGDHNLLDRCYFKGKNNLEPLIGNALENSRHNTVQACAFVNIPYDVGNGHEIIRVWGSGKFDEKTKDGAFFTIQGNVFEHADGEGTEIISLKSNFNQVLGNTVRASRGGINIRRGANNTVKANVILGEGVAGAHGLRMSGANHVVQGNLVAHCDYGIRLSAGEYVAAALTPAFVPHEKNNAESARNVAGVVTAYPPSRKVTLSGNVVLGASGPDLEVGSDYKKHWPEEQLVLLPADCDISGNRFIRPAGGNSVELATADPALPAVVNRATPNRYRGNLLLGGKPAPTPAEAGCKQAPLPAGWTENKEIADFHPLALNDVGPAWVNALRREGQFEVENDLSCSRLPEGATKKKKVKVK